MGAEKKANSEDRGNARLYALAVFLTALASLVSACAGCSPHHW
jgi:hypothetical protein